MSSFTPISALVGGALIAVSLAVMLIATGRIIGLSGLFAGLLRMPSGDSAWRAYFIAGMFAVGGVFRVLEPATFDYAARVPLWLVAVSGVLVGVGTRASNGCTSGHGLCGMSRLSKRSIIATITFFAIGVATATLIGTVQRSS
jgi:uncharacterized membrane protein YedE/YeeE